GSLGLADAGVRRRTHEGCQQDFWERGMAGSSTPGPGDQVLLRGDVLLQRKGAAEPRHLVLWEDRFSFFTREEDFSAQQRPRAQVPLDALLGVQVDEDTVTLSLSDRELSFRTAGGRKDAQGWGEAFNAARSQQAASAELAELEGSQADSPLCLHEGELTMTQSAAAGQRDAWLPPVSGGHFVLYRDRLEWFHTPEALEAGRPDGHVAVEDIEDLEVEDTQVALSSRDGFIRVLQEEHDGDMQGWIDAFAQILETDEAYEPADRTFETNADLAGGPSRCVHEGQLLLAVGPGQVEPRHVVLYGDRIDFFDSQADCDAGGGPALSVETADVCRVSIKDDGFAIGLDDHELELLTPPDVDLEAWISALRSVMESAEDASAETRQAPVLSSPLAMSSASTAATATAFGSKTHAAAEQPLWQEMLDPRVASWLDSSRSCPADSAYFHGVLWLQRAQKQLPRFCVLYTDRIDSWASPLQAARRQPPEGRIMLSDVRGLSLIGGGFVPPGGGRHRGAARAAARPEQGRGGRRRPGRPAVEGSPAAESAERRPATGRTSAALRAPGGDAAAVAEVGGPGPVGQEPPERGGRAVARHQPPQPAGPHLHAAVPPGQRRIRPQTGGQQGDH
ncbi:unnamed protein product, partial [Prorocentrum cordatum]